MVERTELFNHFKSFMAEQTSVTSIQRSTTLQFDLGLEGDDAHELLEEMDRIYDVDWDGFKFQDHFSSEAFYAEHFFQFFWLFTKSGRKKLSELKKHPLTVIDLFERVKGLKK